MSSTATRREGFPGGPVAPDDGELRIAIDKKPYAEIIGHAIAEPEVEICGVLVGTHETDGLGDYLHITDIIRGEAAEQAGAKVTFTHETWNHIHERMDRHHEGKQLVGWYHTHGGFGVFLSEMDRFVHENFFTEPHHVAYVYDPLEGTEGFFWRADTQFCTARRYWLGGREKPVRSKPPGADTDGPNASGDLGAAVTALNHAVTTLAASQRVQPSEAVPMWLWVGVALIAGAMLATVFGGAGGLSRLLGNERTGAGALVLLEHDASSGRAVGVEATVVQEEPGPVFRDRNGRLYVGLVNDAGKLIPFARPEPTRPAPSRPAPQDRGLPIAFWIALAVVGAAVVGFGGFVVIGALRARRTPRGRPAR